MKPTWGAEWRNLWSSGDINVWNARRVGVVAGRVRGNALYMKATVSPALIGNEPEVCTIRVHEDDFCALGDQDAMDGR